MQADTFPMEPTLLKISCPDRVGLLADLTRFVAGHGGNLLEVHQFTDPQTGWFFARLAIDTASLRTPARVIREAFRPLGEALGAEWAFRDTAKPMRTVVLVSRAEHCLHDLLWRWRMREIPIEIPLIISNHEVLRPIAEREGVRFEYVPVDPADREAGFTRVRELAEEAGAELLVLARYMQVLPPEFCRAWHGRIINIHHSFLPSFAGANPYRQAYERGVKLIGATCHYATPELDAGPIIDQEVTRVEHYHTAEDLLRMGRDCERLALARGVRYHAQERVLLHGNRSIVFRH